MKGRENLGLTVNGLPLDDGAGLWVPENQFPGATSRDARVTERWHTDSVKTPGQVHRKKTRKKKPPTREQMLERMHRGLG